MQAHRIASRRDVLAGARGIAVAVQIGVADVRPGGAAALIRLAGAAALEVERLEVAQPRSPRHIAAAVRRIARPQLARAVALEDVGAGFAGAVQGACHGWLPCKTTWRATHVPHAPR